MFQSNNLSTIQFKIISQVNVSESLPLLLLTFSFVSNKAPIKMQCYG